MSDPNTDAGLQEFRADQLKPAKEVLKELEFKLDENGLPILEATNSNAILAIGMAKLAYQFVERLSDRARNRRIEEEVADGVNLRIRPGMGRGMEEVGLHFKKMNIEISIQVANLIWPVRKPKLASGFYATTDGSGRSVPINNWMNGINYSGDD